MILAFEGRIYTESFRELTQYARNRISVEGILGSNGRTYDHKYFQIATRDTLNPRGSTAPNGRYEIRIIWKSAITSDRFQLGNNHRLIGHVKSWWACDLDDLKNHLKSSGRSLDDVTISIY